MFDVVVIADKGKTQQRVRCMIKQRTIGKSRNNLVQIRGWRIAPVHCRVEMTDKGIYIEDTSDGIGTSVNGNKVNYYGLLRSNDVIGIGAYEFRIGTAVGEGIEEVPAPGSDPQDLQDSDWTMETFVGQSIEAATPEARVENIERQRLYLWRNRVHQDVLHMMDLRRTDVAGMDEDELRLKVQSMIEEVIAGLAE